MIEQNDIDLVTDMFIGCIADKYIIRQAPVSDYGYREHSDYWYYTLSSSESEGYQLSTVLSSDTNYINMRIYLEDDISSLSEDILYYSSRLDVIGYTIKLDSYSGWWQFANRTNLYIISISKK